MAAMASADGPARGRFVVLDGIDGCGKSTQARRLVRRLARPGRPQPLHLREPGGSDLGERLRELLLSREHAPSAAVETLLFAAARRQMLDEVVAPALARGQDVVCERSNASTFAYQGIGGGLPEDQVLALLRAWSDEPRPDRVVWLDLPVTLAARRRGRPGDRIEDHGTAFQERVAAGFRRWLERVPGGVRVDADGSEEQVEARVLEALRDLQLEPPRG
jgi:dTMP kinase